MKKIFTSCLCLLLALTTGAETRKNWNFAKGWSMETLANIEQNIQAGGGWTLESEGNYQTGKRNEGPLTVAVNGEDWVIPETEGLEFGAVDAKHIIVAYKNGGGYHGSSFLWLNGSKDQDRFTVTDVKGGNKIFIVYESHNQEQERGFKSVTEGIFVDGTTDMTTSTTIGLDTAVYDVPLYYGETKGIDVTFQATSGFHIYRICVGTELFDEEVVEPVKDKIAYLYDSGYPGYSTDTDIPLDIISNELPLRMENIEIVPIDAAGDVSAVTRDSLSRFNVVVVSDGMRADNPFATTIKEAVAYVPMLNMSPNLYESWGYGKAVQTGTNTMYVDSLTAKLPLFQPSSQSTAPYVDENGNFTMFVSGDGVLGYEAPEGSYFAADSVLARAGGVSVIHIHNMDRNAYMMLPYPLTMGDPEDNCIDLIPNAISMLANTKRAVVKTATPTVTLTCKKLKTEVKFSCITPNTTFRYTTDGSDPAGGGTLYEGPFFVTEAGAVVRVVATGDGFLPSDVAVSEPVVIKDQVATPVITVKEEQGKSIVTISCDTPETEVYFNLSGSDRPADSELYVEPVELTAHATLTAFASHYELVQSELAYAAVAVRGERVRMDTLAHMNSHDAAYPKGDICKAFDYYTKEELVDGDGQPVYGEDGNPLYVPTDSVFYKDFGNGWAVGSKGQRINNQTTGVTNEVGTGVYGPLTVHDTGATNGSMSFLVTKTANDPATAWLQTTVKYQAPFDVVVYLTGQNALGSQNLVDVSVSADSVNWTSIGTVLSYEYKNIEKKMLSYDGADEVYVKLSSATDEAPNTLKTMLFDVLLMNYGEVSKAYEDYVTGIETVEPAGDVVRTEVYTIGGTRTDKLQHGINIVKETYSNGAVKARKVVLK